MDFASATPPPRTVVPRARPAIQWLVTAALAVYAVFVLRYMGAYAGGSDSSGYLNCARLLSAGRTNVPMRLVPGLKPAALPPYAYVPLGFIPNIEEATLTPTYPPGLPLLTMGVAQVAGWELAPGLVMGLHALLGLWLVYRLGRIAGLETGWAGLGALLLAISPLYVFMSLQMMSDVPAAVWVTAAVYFAWISRERPWLALPAGMALAIAVLVRPSNVLALAPVAIALGLDLRRWLLLILGGAPGAIFLGVFNLAAYGRIFATGYVSLGSEFSLAVVPGTLRHYGVWLPVLLTPIVLLALGLPALKRLPSRLVAMLAVWALIFPAFYAFYFHTHETWWYLRFLLPAFPPLIVAALLVAAALADRTSLPFRRWWPAAVAAGVLVNGIAWSRHLYAHESGRGERVYPLTAAWVQKNLPANAVVASMQTSGALFHYTDLALVRWDMISAADFERIAGACAAAGRPIYAVLFPYEIEDKHCAAFDEHLSGHWIQIGFVRHVSIWRYDSPRAPR